MPTQQSCLIQSCIRKKPTRELYLRDHKYGNAVGTEFLGDTQTPDGKS